MFRGLFGFLNDNEKLEELKSSSTSVKSSDWNGIQGQEYIHKLSENNYSNFLKSHNSVLVMFYAPWCGHCKALKPEFALAASRLARSAESGVEAVLASCNCEDYPKMVDRFKVSGYPTLLHFQNGKQVGEYHQGRRASDIISFMKQN